MGACDQFVDDRQSAALNPRVVSGPPRVPPIVRSDPGPGRHDLGADSDGRGAGGGRYRTGVLLFPLDNCRYGCGTKVPHNITGLIGVMDGAQSDLRIGLPWQMVWVHEPMRLTFIVEAHPSVVASIVQRHRGLQKLFDHHWAHLLVLYFRSGEFLRYGPR